MHISSGTGRHLALRRFPESWRDCSGWQQCQADHHWPIGICTPVLTYTHTGSPRPLNRPDTATCPIPRHSGNRIALRGHRSSEQRGSHPVPFPRQRQNMAGAEKPLLLIRQKTGFFSNRSSFLRECFLPQDAILAPLIILAYPVNHVNTATSYCDTINVNSIMFKKGDTRKWAPY